MLILILIVEMEMVFEGDGGKEACLLTRTDSARFSCCRHT